MELFEFTSTNSLWMLKKKEITVDWIWFEFNVGVTYSLPRSEQFVTDHNKCFKNPPSTSLHMATCVRRARVVPLSLYSSFFMRTAACEMRASYSIRFVHPPFSCKLRSSSNPTNKNLMRITVDTANTTFCVSEEQLCNFLVKSCTDGCGHDWRLQF
jgi:hypothetical protein